MDGSYYGGGDEGAEASSDTLGRKDMDKSEDSGSETCLVPKSMFQGKSLKPGDEFYFKIVHLYEDEAEVEYSKGDEKPKKETDTPEEAFDKSFPEGG